MRVLLLLLLLATATAASAAQPAGRFVVEPPEVTSAQMRAPAREMHDSGTLQALAESLNAIFVLPRDVTLRFAQCDEANAYYDADAREIRMCLELLQGMAETLEGQFDGDEQTAEALAGAFIAVVLHEVGHALVDVLEIPVTGREEDAVDQLSAWMLIEADDVDSVLGAAASYYTEPDGSESDESFDVGDEDYAGEHSLDRQRYFNLVCWAYGSDPDNGQSLIDDWNLPTSRAEQCAAEYALLDRSWSRLLRDHLQPDEGVAAAPAMRVPRTPMSVPVDVSDAPRVDEAPRLDDPTRPRIVGRLVPGTMKPLGKQATYRATSAD